MTKKDQLINIFRAGVTAVEGYQATKNALTTISDFQPDLILAVGKAASGMCAGALASLTSACPAIIVTKYQHTDKEMYEHPNVTVIESAHPVPDENSLLAGHTLSKAVTDLAIGSRLLLLVSGGASSLAESLPSDVSLEQWQNLTDHMLSSGFDIGQINSKRKEVSLIKDGKLLKGFKGAEVKVLAISDVEGDSISVIGSGTGDIKHVASNEAIKSQVSLIATNAVARNACAKQATSLGLKVKNNIENMYQDVSILAPSIAKQLLSADKGVYIFGGEPTIHLPENPGSGGRNQSLALTLATLIHGNNNINILVAGTDGSDGPTNAAGAIVNGHSTIDQREAKQFLKNADAGTYLRKTGDIFITGPTNTNVMDLVIAIVD